MSRPTRKIAGAEVSAMGVGAMSFAEFYGPTTEENSWAVLDAAMELGVTHIDTSNVYGMGRSEEAIGAYLRRNGAAREVFHIATKAGISKDAAGNRCFDNSPEHLEAELDRSLSRMGIEAVDLFYVHRREEARPIEEVTATLVALRDKGKIKGFGFSEIAPASLRRAAAVAPVAAVQSEYSLATRAPELGLVQECARQGTALVAFSPLGRAFLTDRPIEAERVPTLAWMKSNPRFLSPNYEANIAATDRFRALAADMGEPAAALAVAWLLAQGSQILPIPGTRSVAHFRECVRGTELALSTEDLARIEEALPVGWAHGDRYSVGQYVGPERYC
ncbi:MULTISPECIES: aldo/keto reductase [Marinovum]|uniref:Predicted oxidoreductase n=1 Tax=Marinovum algicola TaxID=42444 RepID=A0A975WFE8_9RHOB|nr:aldo/keto reductase [Marinovum algicola]SEK10740.1 Predicted oxidoreductase [Marinovum algicola]SLN77394.1 General stress protein 69 [Marinovum algicola]